MKPRLFTIKDLAFLSERIRYIKLGPGQIGEEIERIFKTLKAAGLKGYQRFKDHFSATDEAKEFGKLYLALADVGFIQIKDEATADGAYDIHPAMIRIFPGPLFPKVKNPEKAITLGSRAKRLFDYFCAAYKFHRRKVDSKGNTTDIPEEYIILAAGRDINHFKKMAEKMDDETIQKKIDALFSSTDPFILKVKPTPGFLLSQINKLDLPVEPPKKEEFKPRAIEYYKKHGLDLAPLSEETIQELESAYLTEPQRIEEYKKLLGAAQ